MFCTNCGAELPDGSRFCTKCGAKIEDSAPSRLLEEKTEQDTTEYNESTQSVDNAIEEKGFWEKIKKYGNAIYTAAVVVFGILAMTGAFDEVFAANYNNDAGAIIFVVIIVSAILKNIIGWAEKNYRKKHPEYFSEKKNGGVFFVANALIVVGTVIGIVYALVVPSNKYIEMVKNAHPEGYPNATYGEAFDDFFSNPKWNYFSGGVNGTTDIVEFNGGCSYDGESANVTIQFEVDADMGMFEWSYFGINGEGQDTLTAGIFLMKIFEEYENDDISDNSLDDMGQDERISDNDEDASALYEDVSNIDESEDEENASDVSADIDNRDVYDYGALNYAGEYQGYGGYSIYFNAYTSVESDEVGNAAIYYEGEFVSNQSVYICTDRGDWSDWDYDQFYVMYGDGYNEYLGFYESDGEMMVDYNGPTKNYDILEMTEHYE